MTFLFKYRKSGYFRPWKRRKVKGFAYDAALNRCILFLPEEEGRIEIPAWHLYEVKLGPDWVIAEKQADLPKS